MRWRTSSSRHEGSARGLGIGAALIVFGSAAACALPLASGPTECPAALLEGTLVPDGPGLAVQQHEIDVIYPVEWPEGWAVREVDGRRRVLDQSGRIVGTEGDRFSAGGGFTSGPVEVFRPCGGIRFTSGP